jgi:hypothetical protein
MKNYQRVRLARNIDQIIERACGRPRDRCVVKVMDFSGDTLHAVRQIDQALTGIRADGFAPDVLMTERVEMLVNGEWDFYDLYCIPHRRESYAVLCSDRGVLYRYDLI